MSPVVGHPVVDITGVGRTRGRRIVKRGLDLLLSLLLLLVLSPLLLLIALLIRVTTPGEALFRQTRVGYQGRTFGIYKFRTMYDGSGDDRHRKYVQELLAEDDKAASEGGLYKLARDPRITPIGHMLRRTSIDELPQLLNVVRGEMSLVGPRPVVPYEAALFSPAHCARFYVLPGLTGLWQVNGRNRLTMRQALDLDVQYVARQSLPLDLMILAKTIPVVLFARDTV